MRSASLRFGSGGPSAAYLAARWNFSGYETRAATGGGTANELGAAPAEPLGAERPFGACSNDRLTARTCEK